MIKKAQEWLAEKGFKHLVLIIAGILIYFLFPDLFKPVAIVLIWEFLRLNWQSIKDLSTVDEKIESEFEDLKEKYKNLKEDLDRVKQKTGAH